VQVAHDVLIRAHQEKADVVRFGQTVAVGLSLLQAAAVSRTSRRSMNLAHLPVGIARDVPSVTSRVGRSFRRAIGMMGNKLDPAPMIEQRLENGKIAEILVARLSSEQADFSGV